MAEASDIQNDIVTYLKNHNVPIAEILDIRKRPSSDQQLFLLKDTLFALSKDDSLGYRRRLEAYRLLVEKGIIYPINLDDLIGELIAPLDLGYEDFIDITIEQNLPIQRSPADLVLMILLPITTPIGPARLFVVVDRTTNRVLRATVYPSQEVAETR